MSVGLPPSGPDDASITPHPNPHCLCRQTCAPSPSNTSDPPRLISARSLSLDSLYPFLLSSSPLRTLERARDASPSHTSLSPSCRDDTSTDLFSLPKADESTAGTMDGCQVVRVLELEGKPGLATCATSSAPRRSPETLPRHDSIPSRPRVVLWTRAPRTASHGPPGGGMSLLRVYEGVIPYPEDRP